MSGKKRWSNLHFQSCFTGISDEYIKGDNHHSAVVKVRCYKVPSQRSIPVPAMEFF